MMIIPDPTWDGTAVAAIAACMDDKKQRKWMYGSGRVFFKHRRAQFHLKEMRLAVEQMVESMQPVRLDLAETRPFKLQRPTDGNTSLSHRWVF